MRKLRMVAMCGLLAVCGARLAHAATIEGEILRITAERTGMLVDLRGDTTVESGTKVTVTVDGKKRTGKVTKVTENGRAFIVMNKGLPKAVNVGDEVAMDSEGAPAPEDKGVTLAKGGYTK